MSSIAKWFLKTGGVLVLIGAALLWGKRLRLPENLPGDISWSIGSRRMFVPLGTTALVGLLLTIYLNIFQKTAERDS